jgi:hypothetical protein
MLKVFPDVDSGPFDPVFIVWSEVVIFVKVGDVDGFTWSTVAGMLALAPWLNAVKN